MATSTDTSGMEFEVFLSFRGSDTRNNFASCLYHAMDEKGIRVFRDDKELQVGDKIEKLLKALDDSQIYIPIFSQDFASSAWCLREVARMVDRTSKSDGKKEILPLFFDVEPEDVKLRTELYENALSKLEEEKKYDPDEVKRWRDALREVATRVGWKLGGKEHGELMKTIVREVLLKLKVKNRSLPDKLVVMNGEKDIEDMLNAHSAGHARFIIIHGTGGIGKTTLASVIFNRFRSKFDYSSFLEDVHGLSERHGLSYVQKKLLSDTLGSNSADKIQDTNDGMKGISDGLSNKKVLIVIDNVNAKKQLENLAGGCRWFGPGSKIIVTVRDRRTIIDRTIPDEENQTGSSYYMEHSVKEMPVHQAIELFSKHAFRSDSPPVEWHSFSEEVVSSIGRLPLTLEVVGSLFARTARSEWRETLKDLKHVPRDEVRDTLMISINKLDHRKKDIFLDIACFCIGEDTTKAYYMWDDCEYSPRSAIDDLLLMLLIKIDENNKFWMHDEIRDLGRYIDKEKKFADAGNGHWVKIDEKTPRSVPRSNKRKRDARALSWGISHDLTPEDIACWPELRFLGGERLNFVGDFSDLLPDLRWLSWRHCPQEFSATNLHLMDLVVLDLSNSKITDDWGGWMQIKMAKNLKMLDLTECDALTTTPNFSEFGKLEKLILKRCRNLHTIHSSIGKLKSLNTLDIRECTSLEGLPKEIGSLECLSKINMPERSDCPEQRRSVGYCSTYWGIKKLPHSIGRLKNLTHLDLSHCKDLRELPDSIGELKALVELDLRFTGISLLPYSIGGLKNLKRLFLFECRSLLELPDSIEGLESLVELYSSFLGISVLPDSIGRLPSLTHLSFHECKNLLQLPGSIGEIKSFVMLDFERSGISVLPDSIGRLKNLKWLILSGCKNIHKLSDSIGELESLVDLDLNFTRISILPDSIGRLPSLTHLSFLECKNLLQLPGSIGEIKSLVTLNLERSGISVLPDSIGRLKNLKRLILSGCKNIHKLPDSIEGLESLVDLDLNFTRISILPDSIGRLPSLTHLSFCGCKNLLQLPGSIGKLKSLNTLDIRGCTSLEGLPKEISSLECLSKINMRERSDCPELRRSAIYCGPCGIKKLPHSIGRLKNLTHLDLSHCNDLRELPDSIGELKSLVELDLGFTGISLLPYSIGRLKNLKWLILSGCENIHKLPDSIGELKSLVSLDLNLTGISILPDSIGRLMSLTHLSFRECKNLLQLPGSIGEIKSLVSLNFKSSGISVLPDSIGRLKNLKWLILYGCENIHKLPDSIGELESLVTLDLKFTGISILPDFIGRLTSLTRLGYPICKSGMDLARTLSDKEWDKESLTSLKILGFSVLPDSFERLTNLKHLAFSLGGGTYIVFRFLSGNRNHWSSWD